jgi:AIG2-like family
MLHFAYGSNMHLGLMRARCPEARVIGRAVLRNHRFVITRDGYASVKAALGGVVHGLLWHVSPRDLAALNAYENTDAGLFRRVLLSVQTQGRSAKALVYIGRSGAPGRARAGYMELVAAAAREAGLPSDYVAGLERLQALPGRAAVAPNGVRYEQRGA